MLLTAPDPIPTHDPAHQPPGWADRLPPGGCAVFLSDPRTASPVTPAGQPTPPDVRPVCYPFASLTDAAAWCRSLIATHETMHCEIFDARGRGAGPVAELVSPRHARRLPSRRRANRMVAVALLLIAAAGPLIWFDWHVHNLTLVWPTYAGLNLFVVGAFVFAWSLSERKQAAARSSSS